MNIDEIEAKLQTLREQYKHSLYDKRQIIVRQARALEIAREKLLRRNPKQLKI